MPFRAVVRAIALALPAIIFACGAGADLVIRRAEETSTSPPGSDRVPLRLRHGLPTFEATLRSPSGEEVSGTLALDTGAPALAVLARVWNRLRLDTLEIEGRTRRYRLRSLDAVEMGSLRAAGLAVGGVLADSVLEPGDLGLFAPSLLPDRAHVIDYATREWTMVRPAWIGHDTSAVAASSGLTGRIRRSRAAYATLLPPGAIAVPFRLFEGGRILVSARASDPAASWRGGALTLLLDTGASSCVLFRDVLAERVSRAPRWPWRRDVPLHTVLGVARTDLTVVPSLALEEASRSLAVERVETCVTDRRSLPDLESTLPERIHGLLGATFLARFRVILDYRDQVLWLDPAQAVTARSFDRHHVGLRLEQRWGVLRVARVAAGSMAQSAGIESGDLVVSIDGEPVAGADPELAEQRLEGPVGSSVIVVVKREGMTRRLQLARDTPP